ncbi:hypothetical protein OH76DRAFT_1561816 [Lentinus brumalis]|uniref:Fungal-type protein kinase domain-containing protein n=1 Tax=Lentinus brumalis TaxID=2498619 RepID=A0A371CL48_9APHY|nr:hypothetical protein OH76DRAFT_1561816 [Polyporus brumalis]
MPASAMPVREFLQAFFPGPEPHHKYPRQCKGAPPVMNPHIVSKIRKAATASDERAIACAWVQWMAQQESSRPCSGYRMSLLQDQHGGGQYKAHGVVLSDGRPQPDAACALFVFKAGGTKFDPWTRKNGRKGDADAQTRTDVRCELTEYVACTLCRQHRSAILLFFVNGLQMRVTRWHRGGTVFSESFDYTQDRALLRDLLRAFSRLDSGGLGFDCSVAPLNPSDGDYAAMTRLGEPQDSDISEEEGTVVDPKLDRPYVFKYVRAAFAASIAVDALRYRISIPAVEGSRLFLAGKPTVLAASRSGRDTRGYVAWDVTGEGFVWLKDVWRPVYKNKNIESEGSVLKTLNGAVVRNVPTFVCDGELDYNAENSGSATSPANEEAAGANTHDEDDALQGRSNRGKHKYRHYRIVIQEVGMHLMAFKNGKQLVSVVRDCVQAHADAVYKARTLHGDVSTGNVLICPTVVRSDVDGKLRVVWKGVLIDWELARPVAEDLQVSSGMRTWQFTSAWVLDNSSTALTSADELESFFYIILYNALRFLRSTCLDVEKAIFDYFDASERVGTEYRCGHNKRRSMDHGCLPKVCGRLYHWLDDTGKSADHPINFMIGTLLMWFEARYTILNATDDDFIAALAGIKAVTDKVRELARKLEDHTALLELLDECLLRDWPQMDKIGDLLADPRCEEESSSEDEPEPEPPSKRLRKDTPQTRKRKATPRPVGHRSRSAGRSV